MINLNDIHKLLDISKISNYENLDFIKCFLLAILAYSKDGIQYKELEAALDIPSKKLKSNLDKLVENKYVKKLKSQLDSEKLDIYLLADKGIEEINKIKEWMNLFLKVVGKIGK